MSRLDVSGLVAGYDGPPIVHGVSVWAESGKVSVVLGANGAGKSTLLKSIIGELRPSAGTVSLDGAAVTGTPPYKLVRKGIGYLPQLMSVFDELTVTENLEMGAFTRRQNLSARIGEVFELFEDLAVKRKVRAGTLSGGQQRMLALARTLMSEPRIVILDEPTAGLSPAYAETVWDQVERLRARDLGFLVVEQTVRVALQHADCAFVLASGREVASGPPAEIGTADELAALFVG